MFTELLLQWLQYTALAVKAFLDVEIWLFCIFCFEKTSSLCWSFWCICCTLNCGFHSSISCIIMRWEGVTWNFVMYPQLISQATRKCSQIFGLQGNLNILIHFPLDFHGICIGASYWNWTLYIIFQKVQSGAILMLSFLSDPLQNRGGCKSSCCCLGGKRQGEKITNKI